MMVTFHFKLKNIYIAKTRGMIISGHVMLDFFGMLQARKRHQFKTSSIHTNVMNIWMT